MRILVTGSNGLVGSSLKKILGNSHFYHTREDADLTNEEQTRRYIKHQILNNGVDTIIHCAAKVGGVQANSNNNELFFEQNYLINNNVLLASYENKVSNFVNVLSTCIFPNNNVTYPLTPDQIDLGRPHDSNSGYSYAKRLSGYQTKIFREVLGLNWINVVPTNVYGPNDNFSLISGHMIPSIIHRAFLCKKNNEKFVVWGDGSPLRQFIHCDDLSNNILWAINNWKSELPFMIVNEKEHSVMDIVKLVLEEFEISENDLVFDKDKPRGQFRKPAKSDVPKDYRYIDIKNGIKETIEWFNKNYHNLRK